MGKTRRKKKLEKRKNYNPPGKQLGSRGGQVYIWEQKMTTQYPDESAWLREQLYDLIDEIDNPYIDNWRWCLVGDKKAEAKFAVAEARGCCGFAFKEVVHPKSGNTYKIGFNFGH